MKPLTPSEPFPDTLTDGLCFKAVGYPSDLRMPLHSHDYATLIFHLQGTVRHDCRKQSHVITPNTLIFIPENEPHANQLLGGIKTFEIRPRPRWLERLRQIGALVDTPMEYRNGPPAGLAMRIYREFLRRDDLTPLMLEGLTLELFAEMSRRASPKTEHRASLWLKEARDYLHAHFTESPTLEAMADTLGIHPAHLTRAFRQQYHCTIGDYVRQLRVEHASRLLSSSDLPLSQIALDAGFADQSHFNRTFKGITGMTPTEFRKISGNAGSRQK